MHISTELLNAIVSTLSQLPYGQVAQIMTRLQEEIKAQTPQPETKSE